MQFISYIDVVPGGNKTALVLGDAYSTDEKKKINDAIMAADPEIEQVGFVKDAFGKDDCRNTSGPASPSLQMAGGEFCGNATRSAAYYYLQGNPGNLIMTVSGGEKVCCGVYENGDAWCEIPLHTTETALRTEVAAGLTAEANPAEQLTALAPGICRVSLGGITHLVLEPEAAAPYLEDRSDLKTQGLALLEQYGLINLEAAGAIFLERLTDGRLKINPIVWVRDIASLFYETACGSGTTAAAMVLAKEAAMVLAKKSTCKSSAKESTMAEGESQQPEHKQSFNLLQPSGMTIRAEITLDGNTQTVTRAVISGPVQTDLTPRTLSF